MFDIGFSELLVIAVITLIVMGPERLPETVRTIGLWVGRLKQMLSSARNELDREVGMGEVRRQLYNEKIMRDLENNKATLEDALQQSKDQLEEVATDISQVADGTGDNKA
ncbi:MAG: twin-arginine translocase subunit TatB [Porticoccaceae bacterium]|jgi:sec-independent protein translocase protein TatB|nr:twin-arginine translocase subunit TatB [Porticoccaceae bacterium]MBT7375931.1 twin-arginine translocase subunit TatB [Porticoccaceae bacterium]